MRSLAITLCLLTTSLNAAQLTVRLEPRWQGHALKMHEASLMNAAGNQLSVTRLAMLVSHAQLQRVDGTWIGAKDWAAYLDAGKQRLSFTLNGLPPSQFTALRFDLGLDDATDHSDPAKRAVDDPLHPDVNGLHWGWRGGYVFLALEGLISDGHGWSYHLAGQPCRGTIEVPADLDLRQDLVLTLAFEVDRVFASPHRIDITQATSTHSRTDDPLAARLADNAVQAFALLRVEPDLSVKTVDRNAIIQTPALLTDRLPPHFPQALWPQDNPLTEAGVALGQRLFQDPRLSINNGQTCASCHEARHAFTDARPFSLGAEGERGSRNAMPLFNLAWKPAFFWDGRAPTLREQVLQPIQDPHEMHETLDRVVRKIGDLAPLFEKAFGTPDITTESLARALEQHLLSLISADSRMDRTLTKGERLTAQEQRGFELFFTESDPGRGIRGGDCFHCHGGAHFTSNIFTNNGLDRVFIDEGRYRVTRREEDRGKFIVPSLRNVALTAPYMHDGRFSTLEEVMEHYDHGLQPSATLDPNLAKHLPHGGLQLSAQDKAALVAFLRTLTDERLVQAQGL